MVFNNDITADSFELLPAKQPSIIHKYTQFHDRYYAALQYLSNGNLLRAQAIQIACDIRQVITLANSKRHRDIQYMKLLLS